jgi:F-type H+-transporting ATPase subunit delta
MSDVSTKAKAVADDSATVLDDAAPELTRTYAEALLNAAQKEGKVEEVLDELEAVRSDVFERFPAFADMMRSPVRTVPDKDRIIVKTLDGRASPIVVRFLRVLNRHGRLELLGAVIRAARAGWDERQNRRPVTVRSAVPLDETQAAVLRDRLAKSLDATPVLKLEIDPSLIGGLVVQIGDDVYDASIRSHLEQLRHRLIEGKSHEIQSRRDHFSHPE